MLLFWSVLLTVIFRVEKRMVWPYGELEREPQFGDSSGYRDARIKEATDDGFVLLGWSRDVKGPTYRVSYGVLVSPERDLLAMIGAGTLAKIPVQATWLYTPTQDGRCFYSTDKQSGVLIDLSRGWITQLAPEKTFPTLLSRHREWIQQCGVVPRTLTRGKELDEFRALREEHYRSMERAGLIQYIDPGLTRFRFTLWGAAKTAISGYFLGMARQVTQGRFPRTV